MTEAEAFARIVRGIGGRRERRALGDLIDVVTDPVGDGYRWLAEFERGTVAGRATIAAVIRDDAVADLIRVEGTRQERHAARRWARAQGITVAMRGPVPADILAAYRAEGVRA